MPRKSHQTPKPSTDAQSGPHLTRRTLLAASLAAGGTRLVPLAQHAPKARRILTLVYDKSAKAMRAIDRVVYR